MDNNTTTLDSLTVRDAIRMVSVSGQTPTLAAVVAWLETGQAWTTRRAVVAVSDAMGTGAVSLGRAGELHPS